MGNHYSYTFFTLAFSYLSAAIEGVAHHRSQPYAFKAIICTSICHFFNHLLITTKLEDVGRFPLGFDQEPKI